MKKNLKFLGGLLLFIFGVIFEIIVLTIVYKYAILQDEKIKEEVVRLLAEFIPYVAGVQLAVIGISNITIFNRNNNND